MVIRQLLIVGGFKGCAISLVIAFLQGLVVTEGLLLDDMFVKLPSIRLGLFRFIDPTVNALVSVGGRRIGG
ncbi:hypothetical protein D9M71_821530 [compost metagenome]